MSKVKMICNSHFTLHIHIRIYICIEICTRVDKEYRYLGGRDTDTCTEEPSHDCHQALMLG